MFLTSVVIPTFNRAKLLLDLLDCLGKQTYPDDQFEVIVVSDGSTDGTEDAIMQFKSSYMLRFFDTKNIDEFSAAKARNLGIRYATGKIVILLDDDMMPGSNFIEEHHKAHQRCQASKLVVFGPRYGHEFDALVPSDKTSQKLWDDLVHKTNLGEAMKEELWTYAKTDNMSIKKKSPHSKKIVQVN